jgi:hypothetical protein
VTRAELTAELQRVWQALRKAEDATRANAERAGMVPELAVSRGGGSLLAPILVAQAQVLTSLAQLELTTPATGKQK